MHTSIEFRLEGVPDISLYPAAEADVRIAYATSGAGILQIKQDGKPNGPALDLNADDWRALATTALAIADAMAAEPRNAELS